MFGVGLVLVNRCFVTFCHFEASEIISSYNQTLIYILFKSVVYTTHMRIVAHTPKTHLYNRKRKRISRFFINPRLKIKPETTNLLVVSTNSFLQCIS